MQLYSVPQKDTLQIGNTVFTDLLNLIILSASFNNGGGFGTFRKDFASAGYQVTAGKTLYIRAYRIVPTGGAANVANGVDIGYGDTDIGMNAAAGPTNIKRLANSTVNQFTFGSVTTQEFSTFLAIPAAKYPFVAGNTSTYGYVFAFGYEY